MVREGESERYAVTPPYQRGSWRRRGGEVGCEGGGGGERVRGEGQQRGCESCKRGVERVQRRGIERIVRSHPSTACPCQIRSEPPTHPPTRLPAFSVWTGFTLRTGKKVDAREKCHWSHACKSLKWSKGMRTNGILECKCLSKTALYFSMMVRVVAAGGGWLLGREGHRTSQ
jgi:hypothetical protein